jgi:putative ABC transport system permease protein
MAGSTTLIARRSIRSRIGRTVAIIVAVMAGVSFVSGSFVLADSLKSSIDGFISELVQNTDLVIRAERAFDQDDFQGDSAREPIPVEIADDVRGVEGIDIVEPDIQRSASVLDANGDVITTTGPQFGVVWDGESLAGVTLKEGRKPNGADEVVLDKATADRENFTLGDTVGYVTDAGTYEATLVGTIGTADTDSLFGATIVALDLPTALDHYGANGRVDAINLSVVDDDDLDTVKAAVQAAVPDGIEVIDRDELIAETQDTVGQFIDIFQTGLLIFAFITAFVAAFIINNVFQITIGQRLRELALLRAIGANATQVKRLIATEAFGIGVIGTAIGIFGGIGVARLIIALFNTIGAGFPPTGTVLEPRTVIVATIVGLGVTMLSVLIPARRAAKIPPVAAMQPEIGFQAMRTRRLTVGVIMAVVGLIAFLVGMFVQVGGGLGLTVLGGGGVLLLFLGVTSLAATFATPVTRFLGWPIARLFKTPGKLARDNVARAPRRTSSSAAALMIGVALVSAAAVFASSLRNTLVATLDEVVQSDYIIQGVQQGTTFPSAVTDTLSGLPEIQAAMPVQLAFAEIDGDVRTFAAIDPTKATQMINVDLREGDIENLVDNAIAVHTESAEDLGLEIGDTVAATFSNGTNRNVEVAAIFGDNSFGFNWYIGLNTLADVTDAPDANVFGFAKLADGVTPEVGDEAVRQAMEAFPQAKAQSNAEFIQEQEDQINQVLLVITMLLAFAILIAVLGISITLALGVFERTREIGLLRAVGMNRRQVRRSVRWEAVIVSVFGALIGIVLGTGLGVVLSLAVPDNVISELAFSPSIIVTILVGAVIAGLVAALYPSYKASNMNVLEAIATE